jgi:hypothetical protein
MCGREAYTAASTCDYSDFSFKLFYDNLKNSVISVKFELIVALV